MPWFLRVYSTRLLKTLWEKEKLLVTSNFSFCHSVFYSLEELSSVFIKFEIVVCKLFQFIVWERELKLTEFVFEMVENIGLKKKIMVVIIFTLQLNVYKSFFFFFLVGGEGGETQACSVKKVKSTDFLDSYN